MNNDLVIVPTQFAHLIEVREPLPTKAPCPDKTQPYCCYANTVIFYLRPHVVRPWHHFWTYDGNRRAAKPGSMYEEWDRVETKLHHDAVVMFQGERFRCYNGRVKWAEGRWWMYRDARREST